MIATRSGGVFARALVLLLALTSAALAQAPTASDWRSVGVAWTELCTAPCRVTNGSSFAVRVAVGATAPTSDDAAAAVLTSGDATREYVAAGLKVYGRALANPTRVVVEPAGGASGGSGGSSAGVISTRTVCLLPAYAAGGTATCTTYNQDNTTTVVTPTCAANTACQVLAANAGRRTFAAMNRTQNTTCEIGFTAAVAPGLGFGFDGPSGVPGGQGGGTSDVPAHVGTYFAACTGAATLVLASGQ